MFDIILRVLKMNSLVSKSSFIKNSAFKVYYILSSHENTTNCDQCESAWIYTFN